MLSKQIKVNYLCVLHATALTSSSLFALSNSSIHNQANSAIQHWKDAHKQYILKAEFKNKNIPISAVLQLDMTAYRENNDPTMWLISDYVNPELTTFLEKLINTYIKQPVQYTKCNYRFSDHASWHNAGIASAIAYESKICDGNPNVRTSDDTISTLSLPHMKNFAKLAAAFTIELSEPVERN